MSQKSALARILRVVVATVESLEEDQIEQLLSGKGKLTFVTVEKLRGHDLPSTADYDLILQKLGECKDRDEARQVLSAFANKDALVAFARSQKVHVVKDDRREDVEGKIVEFVIGGKLRTEAIQTLNLKGGGAPPRDGQ